MNDDERTRRTQEVRDRVRKGATVPDDVQNLASDELLASLQDGIRSIDHADEEQLGVALQAHGRAHVLEAVTQGAALRASARKRFEETIDEASDGARLLGGAHRFGARTAGLLALAAALVAVVVLRGGGSNSVEVDVSWATVAGLEVAPGGGAWTDSAALTAEVASPGWGAALRGGVTTDDPALRRSAAVVLVGEAYGAAAVVDAEGWLVTASDLVAEAVEEAAWRGMTATVEVELVDVDADGRAIPLGGRRTARVARHDPERGLSLLRVDDVRDPLSGALTLASAAPGEGQALALIPAPDIDGEIALRGTAGARWSDDRGRAGFVQEGAVYLPGTAGAPIVRLGDSGAAQLVGIALGSADGSILAADRDAIEALIADLPPAPEPFPPDPSTFALGGSVQTDTWDANGRLEGQARVEHRTNAAGERSTAIFVSSGMAVEPRQDGLAAGDWQVLVLLGTDGRRAIGVRGDAQTPTRIWATSGGDDPATRLWEHDAQQPWRVRPVDGQAAKIRCSEEQRELLRSVLGTL